jgi:betaine-homocysteine S-methyltransferase
MTGQTNGIKKGAGLRQRLETGPLICAEGYLFELERRGYLQAGAFVPEVVLEFPEAVIELHREFLRAGSDVMVALTYYAHREKLRLVGRENDLERMNREAIRLASEVAAEGDALVAGNICNTNIFVPGDTDSARQVRAIFEEQVGWAADAGVDFLLAETISFLGEAEIALDVIRQSGLPSVINFAIHKNGLLRDGATPAEAARRIADQGADVVGLNCIRGPATIMPHLKAIRAAVDIHVAGLPVPFRTTEHEPTFESLTDHGRTHHLPAGRSFPAALDPFTCTRYELADFAVDAYAMGIRYIGACCGAGPHHIRSMAEALGRQPRASRYSPDMSKHYALGTDPMLKPSYREFVPDL